MSRAIWSNAVLGERRGWVIGWSAVMLSLFVVVAVILFVFGSDQPSRQVIGSAIPLALLALFYWLRYVPGAVRQNSPANARLVPGLHRAVRRTTVLAWGLTLAPLALFASGFEHGALMFVALGVMMTSIGIARGGSLTGTVIFALAALTASLAANRPALVAWLSTAPVLAALFLLGVIYAWSGLRATFPFGGERHWKLLPAQEAQRAIGGSSWGRDWRVARTRVWLYGWLLRRDLRPCARPAHFLLHALGPGNHRFDFIWYLLPALLLALLARLVLAALGLGVSNVPLELIVIFSVSTIPSQGPNLHRLVASMRNTRGEQSLVRLAPRAPRADQLGRVVAGQMLRVCLSDWLACGVGALAVMLLFGAGFKELAVLASLQCTCLAMVGWPLRDYAKARSALPVVIAQTVLVAGLAFSLYLVREQPVLWAALLAAQTGCALAIVYQRWKTMAGAAPPFPALA